MQRCGNSGIRPCGTNVRWVLEPWPIAVHYVCSKWFWIDLFSILTLRTGVAPSRLASLRHATLLRDNGFTIVRRTGLAPELIESARDENALGP